MINLVKDTLAETKQKMSDRMHGRCTFNEADFDHDELEAMEVLYNIFNCMSDQLIQELELQKEDEPQSKIIEEPPVIYQESENVREVFKRLSAKALLGEGTTETVSKNDLSTLLLSYQLLLNKNKQ